MRCQLTHSQFPFPRGGACGAQEAFPRALGGPLGCNAMPPPPLTVGQKLPDMGDGGGGGGITSQGL